MLNPLELSQLFVNATSLLQRDVPEILDLDVRSKADNFALDLVAESTDNRKRKKERRDPDGYSGNRDIGNKPQKPLAFRLALHAFQITECNETFKW